MYRPDYTITEALLARISNAEALRTRILTAPVQVAWLEAIRIDALIRRAHFSTAIEGNPLTLPEVQALAGTRQARVRDRAKQEVLNYLATLRWIARQPATTRVTEASLLKLHRLLMRGLLPPQHIGHYKRTANVVMSAGRVVYRPPGPAAAKPGTRALIAWLEGPGHSMHPIVASACVHYELARLHPFTDGNGRLARALATWVLYHRGFDTEHLFAVDQYYKEDHEGYYAVLQRVDRADEDLTSWMEYVALAVEQTLQRTYERIQHLALPRSARWLTLTRQQERLVIELRGRGRATVADLQRLLGVERVQVYRILRPLVAGGVIRKSTSRPVVYALST